LGSRALKQFRRLILLFNKRLASTTNNIKANKRRLLYRIIVYYLSQGFSPDNITIITFNHDLQAEKMLLRLSQTKRWLSREVFNFPTCYEISFHGITSPSGKPTGKNLFTSSRNKKGIKILKLHGSLNWYSEYSKKKVSHKKMFKKDRKIRVTRRKYISPTMTYTSKNKFFYTLPVIIPPITHKASIIPGKIGDLWQIAEKKLREANEITVFGYSCPPLDFESSNLIRRSIKSNTNCNKISVIDPDSKVVKRYADLINPKCLHYYTDAKYFLPKM